MPLPEIKHYAQLARYDARTFEIGLSTFHAAPGESVPIYDPARSVVDAMRLRTTVGETAALHSLRRYLTGARANPRLLIDYARRLNVEGPVTRAAEVILS